MSKAKRRPAAKAGKGLPLFPIAIAVIVLVGVVAIVATVASNKSSTNAASKPTEFETAPVTVTGDALPAMVETGQNDPAVGQAAPELAGKGFDGQPVTVKNDGRAKAVVFVAHWCPHCQREVPRLKDYLDKKGMPEGVDLYLVATSTQKGADNYPPSAWLRREGMGDIPTIADDAQGSAHAAYGNGGFPFLVVLDKDGKVAVRTSGELPDDAYDKMFGAVATKG